MISMLCCSQISSSRNKENYYVLGIYFIVIKDISTRQEIYKLQICTVVVRRLIILR